MRVDCVQAYSLKIPLVKPYHWAGGDLNHYDTIIIIIRSEGRVGLGECTTVYGYSWEDSDQAWEFVRQHGADICGQDLYPAYQKLQELRHRYPFSVSAFSTAFEEILNTEPLIPPSTEQHMQILGTINVEHLDEIKAVVSQLLSAGYQTLKVKVGFDLAHDIAKAQLVQSLVEDKAKVRFDANQAYSLSQARIFTRNIDPSNVELFEQPFASNAWEEMSELARDCPVPLMLDESIYSEADIDRAAALSCAQFIKLKLMKAGGAESLRNQIRRIQQRGMGVIIGNGAAADIGCYHELRVASFCGVDTAGEMNGFLKSQKSLLRRPIPITGPDVLIPAGFRLELDGSSLEQFTVSHLIWE